MDQTERRNATRARCLYGGHIAFGKGRLTLDCLVRNLSPDGALLSFQNGGTVPDHFDLVIGPLGRPVPAHIVWRDGTRYGIAFEPLAAEVAKPAVPALALADRLKGYSSPETPVSRAP